MYSLPLYKLDPAFAPRSNGELPPLRDDLLSPTNVQSIESLLNIVFDLIADRVRFCEGGAVLECSEQLLAFEAGSFDRLPTVAFAAQKWFDDWGETGIRPTHCDWAVQLGMPEDRVCTLTHRLANELAHPNRTRIIRIPLLDVVLKIPPARRLLPPTAAPTQTPIASEVVVSGSSAYVPYLSATGQLVHVPLEEATSPALQVAPSRVERRVVRTAKKRDGRE
jgi:hypothetical protein